MIHVLKIALKRGLSSQSQGLDDGSIALHIVVLDVVQEPSAPTDHHQQASSGVMVFFVYLEMFRQVRNAVGEKSDLNLRGAGVALMFFKTIDEFLFIFGC